MLPFDDPCFPRVSRDVKQQTQKDNQTLVTRLQTVLMELEKEKQRPTVVNNPSADTIEQASHARSTVQTVAYPLERDKSCSRNFGSHEVLHTKDITWRTDFWPVMHAPRDRAGPA